MPRFYKQEKLVSVSELVGWLVRESDNRRGSVVVSYCYEKLVAEAWELRGREDSPLEAASRQRQ
jgi:hypothetical protein